jgi:hypothetical protein
MSGQVSQYHIAARRWLRWSIHPYGEVAGRIGQCCAAEESHGDYGGMGSRAAVEIRMDVCGLAASTFFLWLELRFC